MNVTIPAGMAIRSGAADLDFTDLAPGSERSSPTEWIDDGRTLSIPFDPEPTTGQQQLIRRRVLTRDAAEERLVASLAEEYPGATDVERLLIEWLVGRIEGWS